jgi:hypothetical protein
MRTAVIIIKYVNCGISFFRGLVEAGVTGMTDTLKLGEKSDAGAGRSLYNPRCARVGRPTK